MENLLIDNMLENAKIGIWVIELSHNKKNDPKMFGNTHMKLLLGVADSYSPEEVYQFWVERIHPAYVSYVEEAVERLISGNKAGSRISLETSLKWLDVYTMWRVSQY